jgi:signal transduction histidine kinase
MRHAALSMRWWLALAFAGIAAVTALTVAQMLTARSEAAIRERARELAGGTALTAAAELSSTRSREHARTLAAQLGASRDVSLFVLDDDGALLTPTRAGGITVTSLPNYGELRETALGGRRLIETVADGRLVTVSLPLRRGPGAALIAVVARPDLETALGIVRDEIVRAALWAVLIGAVVGIGVALLITRRLRRIAAAAADIEQGRFETKLSPLFPDELGALAGTIDRMRERLRASFDRLEGERDRLHRLLEQLQEGVVAVDRDLTVEFANSRARALLGAGLAPARQLPEPWPSFSLGDAVTASFAPGAEVAATRVEVPGARMYVVALLPPEQPSGACVVVITDVTEQERRERAEREFVTNAAHELRTPLAAIASAVEVLQSGAKEQPGDRDRFLEVVERQTSRLTRLAHALLTLARAQTRAEPVQLEPIALEPVLREVAAGAGTATVALEAHDDVAVLAHRELLQQALENLTTNARKHAANGALGLRVAAGPDDRVRIDVADGGPGMSELAADRAPDRFYRAPGASADGFGLGLSIVREAVGAMGGTLAIDSRPGRGTTVSIFLARAQTEVTE